MTKTISQKNSNLVLAIRLLQQLRNGSHGFSLVEVMVSIILLTAFLSVGMTAIATASLVKAKANTSTVATNWIKEDLEAVRSQADQVSFASSRCNPTGTNPSASGFATALQQSLPSLARSGSQTVGGKTYTLTRQVAVSATAPYDVLQLTYSVTESGGTASIATMYTEVIPNAALQCSRFQ